MFATGSHTIVLSCIVLIDCPQWAGS